MESIGLLLARADFTTVFDQSLEWKTAAHAPAPRPFDEDTGTLRDNNADPNDLKRQGWGLVVPENDAVGNHLRALVEPLVQARKQQSGREPVVYKVPPNMGPEECSQWWRDVYQDDDVIDSQRPRYLLILGDADLISWDFQQRISLDIFAGRLAFSKDDDYTSYVDKLLEHERHVPTDGARALFYAVRDGYVATNIGRRGLLKPTIATIQKYERQGELQIKEMKWLDEKEAHVSADDFLQTAAQPIPTVLFSISHGVGAPRDGWESYEEQRRRQGEMVLHRRLLTADELRHRPFLPGGVWFNFSCFSAGTPKESAYDLWLAELKELGHFQGSLDDIRASLPLDGKDPFVAALPQAALANPDGPLAMFGHVDLAWTYGFQELIIKNGNIEAKNRPSRFEGIFRGLMEGKRFGAALAALQRELNAAQSDLMAMYNREAQLKAKGAPPPTDPARMSKKAALWIERQDLAAYVLLGDPAARIPVTSTL